MENKLESDYEKFAKGRQNAAEEHQSFVDAADKYLDGLAVRQNKSRQEILEEKFEEYKDILESDLMEPMKTADRMGHLKRAIYVHEVRPMEKKKEEALKEAA
jgi:hypothetical protein